MKKLYTLLLALTVLFLTTTAQNREPRICLSETLFQEKAQSDPSLLQNRETLERFTEQYVQQQPGQRNAGVVRAIPVVFHVIHEGSTENISRDQCLDQLRVLNEDFRRLNADAASTPGVFQAIAADSEIEFRIAQLDPNGNCTDGVTRTFSHLTNNARDNVKALIYWPSNKYLNIWIVKTIENTSGGAGFVIGFAQFPGGNAATDGVVLRHDFTGTIGTAATSGYAGRTGSHEVGHWLNLRHIWGDSNCGNDFVTDTPPHEGAHAGCPSHPYHVNNCGAGTSPNGEMFMNYMDYTDGDCQNMFSQGQSTRMNAALSSSLSGRNNLWTPSNLTSTGTDGTPPVVCSPIADFASETKYICEGTTLNFVDGSWNGDPTTWDWQFPGGTPNSSVSQNPSIQYNTPGIYDVTLTVTNSAGTDTKSAPGMIVVSPAAAAINTYPFSEGFETGFPNPDWYVNNSNPATNFWEQTSLAAHTGSNSVQLYNHSGNGAENIDEFITTSFNLSNVSQTTMVFWRAFAIRSNNSIDKLRVLSSTNCGQLWSVRYTKSGTNLATAGLVSSVFIPNASQWDADTVNLSSTSVSGKPNVRFKFEYTQDTGNNIYIDDINLNGVVGINEYINMQAGVDIYPNPSESETKIEFSLKDKAIIRIEIADMTGRIVKTMNELTLQAGDYVYDIDVALASGSYFVNLWIGNEKVSKKLIIN